MFNLYAQLQINPRSLITYRQLAEQYKALGLLNEHAAMVELIEKKFHDHSNPDQEQRLNNPTNN